jgi:integrase
MNADSWTKCQLPKILDRAGLPQSITLHSLQHTYASILCNAALPPKYIAEQLGHASIKTTVDLYEPSSRQRQRRPCGNSIGSSQA